MSEKKFNEIAEEPTYEQTMRDRPNWVVWASSDKRPRAPWVGHLKPCRWSGDLEKDERPEVPFEIAQNWVSHPGTKDLPHEGELGELGLAYILPFGCTDPILMVDLDNVRRDDTGEVHPIALEILIRLESFAEISVSGEGVHVFVRACIPEWYPGKVFKAELDDEAWVGDEVPKVEMYDSARVCLTTGRHLIETPLKAARKQSVVDDLVREYDQTVETVEDICEVEERQTKSQHSLGQKGTRSPYFDHSSVEVLQRSAVQLKKQGTGYRCAHPVHGSRNGNNLGAEGEVWYCHRHSAGGNALMLVAVLEGFVACEKAGTNSLSELDEEQFARLCLVARDKYGFEGKPPSRAIRGTALAYGLVKNPEARIKNIYGITRKFYDASRPGDFGERVPCLADEAANGGEC